MPYTLSGKLDNKKTISLSEGKFEENVREERSYARSMKNKPAEHPAVKVLSNYVEVNNSIINKSFFDLGVSSMQVISLHLELMELYPPLELHDLFYLPMLASLIAPYETIEIE